jgi:hydroxymethylpyrimidine/phosphomethylpyrimidine kinase
LIIAGSDSSAGAGLQADLKTAQRFGIYAQTVVTAVTAQDTESVHAVEAMPTAMVRAQIGAALSDIGADVIKIGMLANADVARAVAESIGEIRVPVVLDPVLVSSSGRALLDRAGIEILKSHLLLRANLVTPNLDECEVLVGLRPQDDATLRKAAQAFHSLGTAAILFKGGHGAGMTSRDVLAQAGKDLVIFESPRQETRHTHGTGCVLSTAIACGLTLGRTMEEAVREAHAFVQNAIRTAPGLGRGHGPLKL